MSPVIGDGSPRGGGIEIGRVDRSRARSCAERRRHREDIVYKVVPLKSSWRARFVATVAAFGIVAAGVLAGAAPAQAAPLSTVSKASSASKTAVPAAAAAELATDFKILLFSKTAGFRHWSIPAGIQAIQQLG